MSLVLHLLGREKFGILDLLVKILVSVFEGMGDRPKSLHSFSTIDSVKINLPKSVCGQIPDVAMVSEWKSELTSRFQRSGDRTLPCSVPL